MLDTVLGAAFRSDKDWVRPHDVLIYGAGLVGVSAAISAAKNGLQVTLVDANCDLLWEVSRSYACVTVPEDPEWQVLVGEMKAALPPQPGLGFPAWAEIAVARVLANLGVKLLFLARPVSLWNGKDGFTHLQLATKSGLRTLSAARFIDASDEGALARAGQTSAATRRPVAYRNAVFARAESWTNDDFLKPGEQSSERVLRLDSTHCYDDAAFSQALGRLRDNALQHLVVTTSFRPLPLYGGDPRIGREPLVDRNLIIAAPARLSGNFDELHMRLHLGQAAGATLLEIAPVFGKAPYEPLVPLVARDIKAEVAVVGTGTGGAVAAIAAARAGAATVCADLNHFPGGIATGSGIHQYWYGISGGLQEEIDDLVQAVSPLFGAKSQFRGFHPDAKRMAYERLFARENIRFERDAMVFAIERSGAKVRECLLATNEGIVRVEADFWIDGTGDGDLCALAGARYARGRESDGVTSPFTQSAVKLMRAANKWYLGELNYDSGWVDATDAGDMTRARLLGLEQVAEIAGSCDDEQLLAVSPMVGLRQARQIETEYVLSLDDLILQRTFSDAVTNVGAHFDNHILDYELESPDAIFWIWCAHQWRTPVASQLSLRSLHPKGLSNVLLACRALGVSRDAHHAIRMMRDMQRLGEAAGTIAATAAGRPNLQEALHAAHPKLLSTGALFPADTIPVKETRYGPDAIAHFSANVDVDIRAALADLRAGERSGRLWHLYRDRECQGVVVREVLSSNDTKASWLAACIVGLWGEPAAEVRLLLALEARETGDRESTAKYCTDPAFQPFPPDWVVAISVLKECGTFRSVSALTGILSDRSLGLDVKVAATRALAAIASRGVALDTERLKVIADRIMGDPVPGMTARPQQFVLSEADEEAIGPSAQRHDMRWKLVLAFAELFKAAGIADPGFAAMLRDDPRSIVRNAFEPKNKISTRCGRPEVR